jgi:hypothetical protein
MKLQRLGNNETTVQIGENTVLYSYSTPVAAFVPGRGYLRTTTHYSVTTSKHINKWAGKDATQVDQSEIDKLAAA